MQLWNIKSKYLSHLYITQRYRRKNDDSFQSCTIFILVACFSLSRFSLTIASLRQTCWLVTNANSTAFFTVSGTIYALPEKSVDHGARKALILKQYMVWTHETLWTYRKVAFYDKTFTSFRQFLYSNLKCFRDFASLCFYRLLLMI